MYYLLGLGLVTVGLVAAFRSTVAGAAERRLAQPAAAGVIYSKRRPLLSETEQALFRRLRQAVADDAYILAKVPLTDLVEVGGAETSRDTALRRIEHRRVDFVIVGRDSYSPLVVVELDRVQQRWGWQKTDALVDTVLNAAGLPVVHLRARRDWNVADLTDTITAGLVQRQHAAGN